MSHQPPDLYTQAETAIAAAKTKLAELAAVLRLRTIDPSTDGDYKHLDNAIWTAENTLIACRDLQNAAAPDDLSAAVRRMRRAVDAAQARLDHLRGTP